MQIAYDYEVKAGRNPEDFSHNGVGYDIQSKNQSEERWIEVKGVSERWNTYTWQAIHQTQIKTLKEYPEKFWLYIIYFDIPKENRREEMLNNIKPDIYIIQGKDLLDRTKFRITEEAYRVSPIKGVSLKTQLQNFKQK